MIALVGDLLFGSRVQGDLAAAGHEVLLVADEPRLREGLAQVSSGQAQGQGQGQGQEAPVQAQVLVMDLTDPDLRGPAILEALRSAGLLGGVASMGFYSHVDVAARERAEQAGFDLVVPRSRMAREGAALVSRLAAGDV